MGRLHRMRWIPLLLVVVVAMGGCTGATIGDGDTLGDPLPSYGLITPAQANTVIHELAGQEDFVLLDIRTPDEVAASHLLGAAQLDFYAPSFREDIAALDRDTTYLIYCRTGNRTGQALGMMQELGFERVYDLGGGISAWAAEGHEMCVGALTDEHVCTGSSNASDT